MFQGHIDLDTATPVEASAIPDVLFERGLYWASGRSGVVNLVAAHKWFNLAALKGPRRCHPAAPRGRRDDVRGRDRHGPARSPRLDDGALAANADGAPVCSTWQRGADPGGHAPRPTDGGLRNAAGYSAYCVIISIR